MRSLSRRGALALVVAAAVIIRLALGWQLVRGPLAGLHRWSQSDMQYFHEWACRIAAGDWLSRDVLPPLHAWHLAVARTCLDRHPDLRDTLDSEFGPEIVAREPERSLWIHWLGRGTFYQEPAYAYFLALCYRLGGAAPLHALFLQSILGVGCAALAFRISARHWGCAAGVVAGLATAAYGPLLAHEGLLVRESVIVFLYLLLADLAEVCLARDRPARWGILGLLGGLALLVKTTFLPFVAGLAACAAACAPRRDLRAVLTRIACIGAGMALAFAPLIARNVSVGVSPLNVCSSGGFNLLRYGIAQVGPWDPSAVDAGGLAELLYETGGGLAPSASALWQTYPDVGSVAGALWRRFDAAWHWWERPDNGSFYSLRLFAPVLAWMPPTFTVVAPLALIGLLIALASWRRHVVPCLLVLAALAPLMVFEAVARFRLPLAVASIPFAALCLGRIGGWLRDGAWRRAAAAAAGVFLLLLWTGRPLPPGVAVVRATDVIAVFHAGCVPELNEDVQRGRPAAAAERIEAFLGRLRGVERPMREESFWRTQDGSRLAAFIADRHDDCAVLRSQCGQAEEARGHRAAAGAWRQKLAVFR